MKIKCYWYMLFIVVLLTSCTDFKPLEVESEKWPDKLYKEPHSIEYELKTINKLISQGTAGTHPVIFTSEIPLTTDAIIQKIQELDGAVRITYHSRFLIEEVDALYRAYFQKDIFDASPTVTHENNKKSESTMFEAMTEHAGVIVRLETIENDEPLVEVTIVYIPKNNRY